MFCNQCEQTAKGTGCTVMGVCGKLAPVADLQDHVIYALRLLSRTALKARAKGVIEQDTDDFTVRALFSTLTNVNFDPAALEEVAREAIRRRKALATKLGCTPDTCDAAVDADWESIRKGRDRPFQRRRERPFRHAAAPVRAEGRSRLCGSRGDPWPA